MSKSPTNQTNFKGSSTKKQRREAATASLRLKPKYRFLETGPRQLELEAGLMRSERSSLIEELCIPVIIF